MTHWPNYNDRYHGASRSACERERGECVSRKRLGNGVQRKEGEHWLKSPTKVEVRSRCLGRIGKGTLDPISDERRGAIRTSRKG